MNKIKVISLLLIIMSILAGCGRKSENRVIQIKGSDTILNLTQKVTEEFLKENPKSKISVTGGGSGTGLAAKINKTADIAMSSRGIKEEELAKAATNNVKIKEVIIGYDAISIITNKNNTITNLTTEQLKDIYLGKITNWKEVGGADKKIVVLSRDSSSGTHVYFKEHILRNGNSKGTEEFGSTVLFLPSNEAIKQQVNSVDGGIGYIGLGYLDDTIKILSIDNVIPTVENVKNKSYSISRAVYWYIDEEMSETTKQLVEYMLSDKGQKIVLDEGFVSIK